MAPEKNISKKKGETGTEGGEKSSTNDHPDGKASKQPSCTDDRLTAVLSQAGSTGALGNLKDAVTFLETFAKTENDLSDDQRGRIEMSLGALHFAGGNMETALKKYNKSVEILPNSVEPLEALAHVHTEMGETESEVRVYEKCLKLEPDTAKFKVLLARALLGRHITLAAEPHFSLKKGDDGLTFQEVGGPPDSNMDKAAYETAKAKYIDGGTKRPVELLKAALECEPTNIDIITNYAQALCIAERRNDALEFLESQINDRGLRNDTLACEYVQTAVLCGEAEKGKQFYDAYYDGELEFTPARLCAACALQAAHGNKSVAIELFESLLRTAPDKYELHLEAGLHMTRAGMETELQQCLQVYIDKNPNSEAAYHYRSVFGVNQSSFFSLTHVAIVLFMALVAYVVISHNTEPFDRHVNAIGRGIASVWRRLVGSGTQTGEEL